MEPRAQDVLRQQKQEMREEAMRRRAALPNGEELSRAVFARLAGLPEYVRAQTVLIYLDARSEVRTCWHLPTLWAEGKRVVVPYCSGEILGLFQLQSLDEVAPGPFQILEPTPENRAALEREIAPGELDLILTPGVAFDRRGGRIGYGKGYFDRLLYAVRPDAVKIGLCFECQLVAEVPRLPHDIRMDKVLTEKAVYP